MNAVREELLLSPSTRSFFVSHSTSIAIRCLISVVNDLLLMVILSCLVHYLDGYITLPLPVTSNRTLTLNRFGWALDKFTLIPSAVWLSDDTRRTDWRLFLLEIFISFVATTVRVGGNDSCCHSSFKLGGRIWLMWLRNHHVISLQRAF